MCVRVPKQYNVEDVSPRFQNNVGTETASPKTETVFSRNEVVSPRIKTQVEKPKLQVQEVKLFD